MASGGCWPWSVTGESCPRMQSMASVWAPTDKMLHQRFVYAKIVIKQMLEKKEEKEHAVSRCPSFPVLFQKLRFRNTAMCLNEMFRGSESS